MGFFEDLQKIEEIGAEAWRLVCHGKEKEALKLIRPLRRSMFVSESERIVALVEARIHILHGEREKARTRLQQSLGYVWNSVDAYEIAREGRPAVSKKAREYHIEFLGGLASLGIFTQFTEEHIASFDVIAHSEEEAIKYIDEWCVFADKENRSLLHCSHAPVTDKEIRNCGVIRAYPFRLDDSEDEIYSELGDLPPSDFEGGECSNRFH